MKVLSLSKYPKSDNLHLKPKALELKAKSTHEREVDILRFTRGEYFYHGSTIGYCMITFMEICRRYMALKFLSDWKIKDHSVVHGVMISPGVLHSITTHFQFVTTCTAEPDHSSNVATAHRYSKQVLEAEHAVQSLAFSIAAVNAGCRMAEWKTNRTWCTQEPATWIAPFACSTRHRMAKHYMAPKLKLNRVL